MDAPKSPVPIPDPLATFGITAADLEQRYWTPDTARGALGYLARLYAQAEERKHAYPGPDDGTPMTPLEYDPIAQSLEDDCRALYNAGLIAAAALADLAPADAPAGTQDGATLAPREVLGQFIMECERKLRLHDQARGHMGWRAGTILGLLARLREEFFELEDIILNTFAGPPQVLAEAADVANLAMMVADRVGGLGWQPSEERDEDLAAITSEQIAAYFDALAHVGRRPDGQPRMPICGIMSASGRHGEMLACAHPPGHDGPHAWASLPTFCNGEVVPNAG